MNYKRRMRNLRAIEEFKEQLKGTHAGLVHAEILSDDIVLTCQLNRHTKQDAVCTMWFYHPVATVMNAEGLRVGFEELCVGFAELSTDYEVIDCQISLEGHDELCRGIKTAEGWTKGMQRIKRFAALDVICEAIKDRVGIAKIITERNARVASSIDNLEEVHRVKALKRCKNVLKEL